MTKKRDRCGGYIPKMPSWGGHPILELLCQVPLVEGLFPAHHRDVETQEVEQYHPPWDGHGPNVPR